MNLRTLFALAALTLTAAACDRQTEILAGNVNIRLTFSPSRVSADDGTALVTVDVDNFSGRPIRLEDLKVNTSAGFERVGAIVANSPTRFTVALNGLSDVALSPVEVSVSIGQAKQTGLLEIVPGDPSGMSLEVGKTSVSADEGVVDLTLRIFDKSNNLTPTAITLSTTAGVVSQLVNQPDGTYTAKLSGLVHTADSPVTVRAQAGTAQAEAVVQVLAGVLDHFTVEDIASPQVVGQYTPFYVTARDQNENLVTGFEEFVTVRTSRGTGDVEVSFKDAGGNYQPAATFTRQFELGVMPATPPEEFRIRTAAPAGIHLIVKDASNKTGTSNTFTVDPAPANQLTIYSKPGFNLIFSADGCVKPTVAGPECLVGATKKPDNTWKQTPLATRLELKLRRYVNSPDDADNMATLIGGRGAEIEVWMTDAEGTRFDADSPTDGPYLGPVEDMQNGRYYVNVYNLRDQALAPYTVTARFVTLLAEIDLNPVPGDLDHFTFPDTPAQRGGLAGLFFTSLTARDMWDNQVFSFQDTTSVYAKVGNNPPVFLAEAPPTLLGATFPFAITIPENVAALPATLRLFAEHGSGISGESNAFLTTPMLHTTTDFVVLLPGQYDNPTPPEPFEAPFFLPNGGSANLTPDLGEVASGMPPAEQVSGEPFQILILARTNGVQLPVPDFAGRVLVQGQGTGLEVVSQNCNLNGGMSLANAGALTPNFVDSGIFPAADGDAWVGAGTNAFTGYESLCYAWVKVSGAALNANIVVNPARSSGIPFQVNGNQSSNFRVRSAPAVTLRFDTIPSPQLATANPDGGKNIFTIIVRGIDADGKPTDNVSCAAPELRSSMYSAGNDPFKYTKVPLPQFDDNGVLIIDDAWVNLSVGNPISLLLNITCGAVGMSATSNVFQVVNSGAVAYEFTNVPTKVKAHQAFEFSARACDAVDGTGKHCLSEDDVARTFTYPVSMTDSSGTLVPRKSKSFVAGILDRQSITIDRVGSSRVCLFAVGIYSCSDPITVEYGEVSYFQFDMQGFPTVITVGTPYNLTMAAYDAGSNKMPNYTGRVYISNLTSTAKFANNNSTYADVTSAVDGGDGKTKLFYCTTAACTTTQPLQVKVGEMSATDYFTITDNRGHTGYSLPRSFRAVYGPVAKMSHTPCATNSTLRRGAYFALCATALDQYDNVKKDYNSSDDWISSSHMLYPDNLFPFVGGIAKKAFYVAGNVTAGTHSVSYSYSIDGNIYGNPSPVGPYYLNTLAPIAYTVTTASTPPAGLKINQAFKLNLKVINNGTGLADTAFRGVLRVTDATDSIQPACGTGQSLGTCGFLEGTTVITGNFTTPANGERDQWFTIPTESYGNFIWITDGFGQSVRVGPFDVQGNLKGFRFSAIPPKIPTGIYQNVTISAIDLNNQIMPLFKAPIQLNNQAANISSNPPLPYTIPATAWASGQVNVSFRVPVASATPDYLTATYGAISSNSTNFTVENAALTKFSWDQVPSPQAGYVDFPVKITARDQFDQQFLYNGTVDFTATNGTTGIAIRPTRSSSFVNGVLGLSPEQKIALDSAPTNGVVITANQTGGGVAGASNPITVAASTVGSFYAVFVTTTVPSDFKEDCTYPLRIQAMSGLDGQGSIVSNFTGTASLRWSYLDPLFGTRQFVGGTADSTSFAPAVTANFVAGVANVNLTIKAQPQNFGQAAAMQVSPFVPTTGIVGYTTAFDLKLPGTCP